MSNVGIDPCLASCWLSAQRGGMTLRTSIRGPVRDAVTHRVLERVIVMVEAADSGYAGHVQGQAWAIPARWVLSGVNAQRAERKPGHRSFLEPAAIHGRSQQAVLAVTG